MAVVSATLTLPALLIMKISGRHSEWPGYLVACLEIGVVSIAFVARPVGQIIEHA